MKHSSKSNFLFSLFVMSLMVSSISCQSFPNVEAGVPWTLAQQRSELFSDVKYDLTFKIPASKNEHVQGELVLSFRTRDASQPLILDFDQPRESVLSVQARNDDLDYEVSNGHLTILDAAQHDGESTVSIRFVAGNSALHRTDEYLYTLFVPDRAATAFPCFNQPNIKARYRLTLDVPARWQAVANGPLQTREINGDRAIYRFAETKPISSYLFAFAAGAFQVETAERPGRTMRMFHRETDTAKLARNRDTIFDLHDSALKWLEDYTGIGYPFDKFDFVLIPSFQFGGMEHPGCIFYRASALLLDPTATQTQKLGQASLIAHETAHMWFGNLVTMNWFDDVWTKEVFANFMAAKIVNPRFPEINHDLRFFLSHYPAAYDVDRSEGANPIHQQLDNLNDAASLYGAIIYQKAPIVMRQLERLVGEQTFRDGLREYLTTFQFGNATWDQLIDILDARSPEDLKAWSHSWIEQAGRPKITPYLALNADGTINSLTLRQSDPTGQGRLWNQRFELVLSSRGKIHTFPIHLHGESVTLEQAAGLPKPTFILADGRGTGYGLFELDPLSRDYLLTNLPAIQDPLMRGVAWMMLWDAMLEQQVRPQQWITIAIKALPLESIELNVQRILECLTITYWRFITSAEQKQLAPTLEGLLWKQMEKAPTTSLKSAYFRAFMSVVRTPEGMMILERIWRQAPEAQVRGLSFSEQDYMTMALELAVRDIPGAADILQEQLNRMKDPERKARFEFVMPALSSDSDTRQAFFHRLTDPEQRRREPWVIEAISYLHHPLRAVASEKFIRPSLDMLQEIQRTGDIFFVKNWLDATLNGHNSEAAAAIVRQFLAENPDYPPRLKGKILQSADGLFRATKLLRPPF